MAVRSPSLTSFGGRLSVTVVGASGGLGNAFVSHLATMPEVSLVYALSRRRPEPLPVNATWLPVDIEDEQTIVKAASAVGRTGKLDLVLVATGILHDAHGLAPEKTWRSLETAALERVFRINTIGPSLVAKHFLPILARGQKSVFAALSARVGSISDNHLGGWHAYRSSKAALNMLIKNFAIELAYRNPTALCVGLHPGTVDTALSAPFQGNIPDGKLFSPVAAAASLLEVVNSLAIGDSGRVFDWQGRPVDW